MSMIRLSSLSTLHLSQSGLGLPDREYYLRDRFLPQKERYQKYVADMLALAGWEEPEKNAADTIALEAKIAEAPDFKPVGYCDLP